MFNGENKGAEWRTYWSGRAQTGDERPCVSPKIERDAELAAFWEANLKTVPTDVGVLDLACGIGIVVRHALRLGFTQVYGLDISPDAIALMQRDNSGAKGLVGSAHEIPLRDDSLGVIASQFGFEYAGVEETIIEVERVLRPGGLFLALVHKTGGAIAIECDAARQDAEAFAATGFVEKARRVFEVAAVLGQNQATRSEFDAATADLRPARARLAQLASAGHQFAAHVLAGTGQLFQRRQNYALDDILGWLSNISAENLAHRDRMQGMLDAALCEEEVGEAFNQMASLGLIVPSVEPLRLGPEKEEVAWILEARKPE